MIGRLIRAEALKLARQRGAMLSAFLLVPVVSSLLAFTLTRLLVVPGLARLDVPLVTAAAQALKVSGNPLAQLFPALGMATLMLVDYRHSGWRHLVPRAGRAELLAAKVTTFVLFAAASLLLVVLGNALAAVAGVLGRGVTPVVADLSVPALLALARAYAVALAELATVGAVAAAVAVATRSLAAAILLPFLLGTVATVEEGLHGLALAQYPLPTIAADLLRAADPVPGGSHLLALAVLLGWCAAGYGIAFAVFARQDLVAE